MPSPWRLLLCQMVMHLSCHGVAASLCHGGTDISATVMENSQLGEFIADIGIVGDPVGSSIRLCLSGENADWFFLEGRTIRLNSTYARTLDREVHGSVLLAKLTCYEDDIVQNQFRIVVEVLNENDNRPHFLQKTIQPFHISELTAVNSVVFTVKAMDADGDTITYVLDRSLPDASFFRISLPNSGRVVLNKPLDYETKTQLELVIIAVERNTRERYNTSASLTVNVLDGDDQYPHFLPCMPVAPDNGMPVDSDNNMPVAPDNGMPVAQDNRSQAVCTNPVYTANVTEKHQATALLFSPGPIQAQDGDRRLDTPLLYTLLSGGDQGRFQIDGQTGAVTLTRRVESRERTPLFRLRVMASQLNDPNKYSVCTALVRVLAENRFPPRFNRTTYRGFLIDSYSPAALVVTYGNQVLLLQASDPDYKQGVNPKIRYSLQPVPGRSGLYHITDEGVLIAKTNRLRAFERHILEVVATDEESGEAATASVDIEVLQRGQPVPRGAEVEERVFGDMDMRMAGGLGGGALLLGGVALFLLLQLVRRWRRRRGRCRGGAQSHDPGGLGGVPLGKHPNVTLRCFQMVTSGRAGPLMEDYLNPAFVGDHAPSAPPGLHGLHGHYTRRASPPPPPPPPAPPAHPPPQRARLVSEMLPSLAAPEPPPPRPRSQRGRAGGKLEEGEGWAGEVLSLAHAGAGGGAGRVGEGPQSDAASAARTREATEPIRTREATEPTGGKTPGWAQEVYNPYKVAEVEENPYKVAEVEENPFKVVKVSESPFKVVKVSESPFKVVDRAENPYKVTPSDSSGYYGDRAAQDRGGARPKAPARPYR